MIADAPQSTNIAILPKEGEEFPTLTVKEARQLTENINHEAEKLRHNLLRFKQGKGWLALGYDSFKAWCIAECRFDWRHAYRLIGVAEVEEELSRIENTDITVSVNVGKQLKKLKSPELKVEAYQVAMGLAGSINATEPTEKQAAQAVEVVKKREMVRQSLHKVVAQVMEGGSLATDEAVQIIKLLNQSPPQTQLYVQQKMADGLKNVKIIENIIYRHREQVNTGKVSRNLTEIDSTGQIAGVALDRATEKDWLRMSAENQSQIVEEEKARKAAEAKALAIANGEKPEPIIEPKAMNAYTNSPEKTLHELNSVLDDKTMDGLFQLMAQERGYVCSESSAYVIGFAPGWNIGGSTMDLPSLKRNGLQCKQGDTIELLMRVKR